MYVDSGDLIHPSFLPRPPPSSPSPSPSPFPFPAPLHKPRMPHIILHSECQLDQSIIIVRDNLCFIMAFLGLHVVLV